MALSLSFLEPLELVHFSPARSSRAGDARVDWLETGDAHIFKADLPGLKKEDIKVELEDRTLSISGERNEESEKNDKWHSVERSRGKFLRRFRLPSNTEADSVTAKVEDGVLTVTVPKIQTKAPKKRSIHVV